MAKKIRIVLTLQLPAGKATPAPPVGTALGPHGINIVEFTKTYNEKTADKVGQIIPAQITIFEDRSFTFVLKTPPAADLLRKAAGVDQGSATTGRETAGTITRDQLREIATDQARRPERQRHRGRDAAGRGHRPQHGHRGRRLAPATERAPVPAPDGDPTRRGRPERRPPARGITHDPARQEVPGRREARRPHEVVRARRGGRPREADVGRQLRPNRRGPHPPRRRSPPRRPDGPRHGGPAARHRQGGAGRRLRPGREGPGGSARRSRRGRVARIS